MLLYEINKFKKSLGLQKVVLELDKIKRGLTDRQQASYFWSFKSVSVSHRDFTLFFVQVT